MSLAPSRVGRALLPLAAVALLGAASRAQNANYDSATPALATLTTNNFFAISSPTIGTTYQLLVQGLPPAAIVILDMSLGQGDIPLLPFGPLLIDPITLFYIQTVASQPVPNGNASFNIPIPNLPALVGFNVYSQCGVFTATSFTFTWGLQTTFLP